MLVRPHLAGAAEARLDLVDDEQGPVRPAQLGSCRPVVLRGEIHALSLDDLDDERGHVPTAQLAIERLDLPEGHLVASGQQRAEPFPEFLPAVEGQRPVAETVERVIRVEDPVPLRGVSRELDRGLHGLRSGITQETAPDALMRPPHQGLRQQAGQQRRVQLHEVREVQLERVVQGLLNHGMATPEREDAEAGQEVEIALAAAVVQVRAFAAHVETVESERLQHLHELRVEVLVVKAEILPLAGLDQRAELEGHLHSPQLPRLAAA